MFLREQADFVFRPLRPSEVGDALEIILEHDEDDHEEAAKTYAAGLEGQFGLLRQDRLIGVTGAKPIPGTDRSYGVSWTYLARSMMGHGHGRFMLESLLEFLEQQDARMVYVQSSDYRDPERGEIYREAHAAYRAVGFVEELRHLHYYEVDESLVVYSRRLQTSEYVSVPPNESAIKLVDIDEIPECDGAYWLAWELTDGEGTTSDVQLIFDQVREWEGRVIFMAFPSDVSQTQEFVIRARFHPAGRLADYYEDGVDQLHFRHDLR
ncbi:GNAT family N-acetyltransferase [Planctomycetaceae bacterium SH139]